jgi:hypothetical protein
MVTGLFQRADARMRIPEAIRKVKAESFSERTPREINEGLCPWFARETLQRAEEAYLSGGLSEMAVIEKFSDQITITDDIVGVIVKGVGHVWVSDGDGQHYDAERPNGVGSWEKLPHCKRHVTQ